jgi:AmiR/NasT family two-component response regulator
MSNPTRTDEATTVHDDLVAAQTKIANLEVALNSSRIIGMALGIVIERCKVSEADAFALLVRVSQQQHRKVREVANDLIFTGVIRDTA